MLAASTVVSRSGYFVFSRDLPRAVEEFERTIRRTNAGIFDHFLPVKPPDGSSIHAPLIAELPQALLRQNPKFRPFMDWQGRRIMRILLLLRQRRGRAQFPQQST